MHDEQYTRCPGCATVFRVTPEQLALRGGQVRCGQCKTVFDGAAQRVALAPTTRAPLAAPAAGTPAAAAASPAPTALPFDEAALGPPTITLREAHALEPIEIPPPPPEHATAATARQVAYEDRFSPPPRSSRARAIGYATGITVLLVAIAAQAIFHFRDAVAAHWPSIRPTLERVCGLAGCAVHPLRDAAMTHLSIDASDLQADPAHRGLLILTATVRNRAGWALEYPYLELTLTDAQDQVVVRRVLAPAEYAGGTADFRQGIAPNAEVAVKLFIDASATSQAGYRLYMFYP